MVVSAQFVHGTKSGVLKFFYTLHVPPRDAVAVSWNTLATQIKSENVRLELSGFR